MEHLLTPGACGYVYAMKNKFEDSFEDEDGATYDEVYEQPYTSV